MSGVVAYFYFRKRKIDVTPAMAQENARLFFMPQFLAGMAFFLFYHIYLKNWFFLIMFVVAVITGAIFNLFNFARLYGYLKQVFAKERNIIILIFFLAFAVRMMFSFNLVYKTTHSSLGRDGYLYASDDGLTYDRTAREILKNPSILRTGGIEIWGNWDEFYSIVLAGIYKLFGRNFYLLTTLQSLWGSFIPVLIFLIGKIIFSRSVGLIAAFILCFKGGLIAISSFMGHEALWVPILYLVIFLLCEYHKDAAKLNIARSVLVSSSLAFLILIRSMYSYFLAYLCLWEAFFLSKVKALKKLFHFFLMASVCIAIILSVFSIFGNRLSPFNNKKTTYLWLCSRQYPPFENIGNERLADFGIDPFKDPKGSIGSIINKPFEFLILALKIYPLRVIGYLETYQFGFFDPVYMVNPAKIPNKFASNLEFYFTLFFLIGLIRCFSKREIITSPVFLVLTYHVILFSLIFCFFSNRLKEISGPLIYLIGSYGFVVILKHLKILKRE